MFNIFLSSSVGFLSFYMFEPLFCVFPLFFSPSLFFLSVLVLGALVLSFSSLFRSLAALVLSFSSLFLSLAALWAPLGPLREALGTSSGVILELFSRFEVVLERHTQKTTSGNRV